ncbi:MAG: GntR family transcriptional regulator [Actinophytocola sp.]|uniref:FadR/GntR family transcriptional regulator n=1 Tax=Actinophytocola sp. TaxID=1872138 RepID=UPI001324C046|nr:FadR/GntR family transcriptional regulator [Actinophytocola sp.]MPZ82509.1 GntR family transcriptional regulator [Actinophytocola sp.]
MTVEDKAGKQATEPELFSPVSLGRVSQVIVDQIRMLIHQGKLKPGDRLPSERELCSRFGVSRVTVREALRVLEAGGLVDIRVGAHGGAFVTTPTNARLGEGLADLLRLSPLTAAEVTEARMVFELGIVPMVVARATEADIAALREICERQKAALKDDTYSMSLSAEFHTKVAACTHNTAIEMLVESFHGPMLMSLKKAKTRAPLMGRKGSAEHARFVDAVADGDVDAATAIMREHLQRTADRVAQTS